MGKYIFWVCLLQKDAIKIWRREAYRTWAVREQKARYQQKRRKLINDGELISNENNKLGTTYLSNHRHDDFKREYLSIHKEAKRIGVTLWILLSILNY